MKKLFLIVIVATSLTSCSTKKVVDFAALSSMVSIHSSQYSSYKTVKEQEAQKYGVQTLVTKYTKEHRDITDKIQKRFTDVRVLLTQVRRLPRVLKMVNEIKAYQREILELVIADPKLVAIGLKTELVLIKRITRLYKYVYYNAIIGSKFNQMISRERLRILDYVIADLRRIRGLCYTVKRKMKYAKYGRFLDKVLEEFDTRKIYNKVDRQKIVDNIKIN